MLYSCAMAKFEKELSLGKDLSDIVKPKENLDFNIFRPSNKNLTVNDLDHNELLILAIILYSNLL